MELPTVQYRRHRLAYTIAAVAGFLAAFQGAYWVIRDSIAPFFSWLFLVAGIIACCVCTWRAIHNSLVLELNKDGVLYKNDLFSWSSLLSYAIRKETGESGSFNYLILHFKDRSEALVIQLDWLDKNETVPEQMAKYAKVFHIGFDGVVEKEN